MNKNVLRICGDGMLLAIYIVLSILTIKITPNLQITFTGLAILMACVLYGTPDAILIAFLGSFVAQLRSEYGLTITTPIWMVPPILRAVVFGIIYDLFLRKGIRLENKKVLFLVFGILAGLVTTAANTLAIYLDAKIIGYPVSMTFFVSIFRFISSIASSVAITIVCLPIIYALRSAGLIHEREEFKKQKENPINQQK